MRLAEQGASVLLADKAKFPRDKPCGGGMTLRAVRQCPVDPSPVVEEWIDEIELRFRYKSSVVHHTNEPVVWMTQRRRLDAFLLDAARERGVEVREGARVAVEPDNSVTISGERFTADALIGADGANGVTAKAVGLGQGIVYGVAYEGNVRYPRLPHERYAQSARARVGRHPGRLRLGVSEGRPRERRRRRLAERRAEAARAPQARVRGSRARAGGSRGAARTPAAAAAAGYAHRRRPGTASSGTPPA